jgi:1,4-dihydroxy-2-naphthoyl-CoA synthase
LRWREPQGATSGLRGAARAPPWFCRLDAGGATRAGATSADGPSIAARLSYKHTNFAVCSSIGNLVTNLSGERSDDGHPDGRHTQAPGRVGPFDLFAPLRTKPVVVAVQRVCFTVGIELMLAADIVIAAEDTRFGQIEVRRGIFANQGATLRIVERAGCGNAMRYLLTGDEFDAATALRLGLVQEVVPTGT